MLTTPVNYTNAKFSYALAIRFIVNSLIGFVSRIQNNLETLVYECYKVIKKNLKFKFL